MALMTRRSTSPIAEMMDWLETMTPFRPSGGEVPEPTRIPIARTGD